MVALISHHTLMADSLSFGSRGHWPSAQIAGCCPEGTWVKEIPWALVWDRACGSQVSAVGKADLGILDLPIGTPHSLSVPFPPDSIGMNWRK